MAGGGQSWSGWRIYLHDVGVSCNESCGEHPERNHGREVEGSNASTHTQGIPGQLQEQGLGAGAHLWLVRSMSLLIPVRFSPNIMVVLAHSCSTTWRSMVTGEERRDVTWSPLNTSPSASAWVLPCRSRCRLEQNHHHHHMASLTPHLLHCDQLGQLFLILFDQLLILEHDLGDWCGPGNSSTQTCCLARGEVLDQVRKADLDDSTALSIS